MKKKSVFFYYFLTFIISCWVLVASIMQTNKMANPTNSKPAFFFRLNFVYLSVHSRRTAQNEPSSPFFFSNERRPIFFLTRIMALVSSDFAIFKGSEKDIVAYHILHFLDVEDGMNLAMVCMKWYKACKEQHEYWKRKVGLFEAFLWGVYPKLDGNEFKIFLHFFCTEKMSAKSIFDWLTCKEHRFILFSIIKNYLKYDLMENWVFSYTMKSAFVGEFWLPKDNIQDVVKHRFQIFIEKEKLVICVKGQEITLSNFLEPFRKNIAIKAKEKENWEQKFNKKQKV